ncbi:MAG: glycoside hydrolase family 3 N-terminal domain-containing protein, partial [Patescibacteria group bacterium]
MMEGYKAAGVVSVPKHFPGYGNVKPDPHASNVSLKTDAKGLAVSLVPFRHILSAGGAGAVMTAHIQVPFFDVKSATVSGKFITQLLRKGWGFDGLVITDDIEMVSAGKSVGETAVESIKAGADVVIVSLTPEKYKVVFESLKNAVLKGDITEQRLNESVGRILKLKPLYKI